MSKISEIMTLIEFPKEAAEFFEEVYAKVEGDKDLMSQLDALEAQYFESFNSEDLENKLTKLAETSNCSKYTIDMLLAIYACIRLRKMYAEKGYTDEFFAHNMKDLTYKLEECKKLHGIWGTFVFPWFNGFYKLERFCLGRLQYNPKPIEIDYKELKKGDMVTTIHIPSSGPLTPESVQESLKTAYDFFGPNCGDRHIFVCDSWLLYPKTCDLYSKESNMRKFYETFEVFLPRENAEDYDLWRIFYTQTKDYKSLPRETGLQKIFYDYLNAGNHFGYGYGVIDYKPE